MDDYKVDEQLKGLISEVLLPLQYAASFAAERYAIKHDVDVDFSLSSAFSTPISKVLTLDDDIARDFVEIYRKLAN